LQANITSMDAVFQDFEKLGTQYGVAIAAYEGGQGMTGTTNEPIKHLAQFDERMYQTYGQYLTFWKQHFGASLFMHFTLAGTPGLPREQASSTASGARSRASRKTSSTCGKNLPTLSGTETVASVTQYCPKYQALADEVPH
jgi:ABC-type microcin C transport system permease subunit YejB